MEKQLHFCLCKQRAAVCLKWRRPFLLVTALISEGAEGAAHRSDCPVLPCLGWLRDCSELIWALNKSYLVSLDLNKYLVRSVFLSALFVMCGFVLF